MELLKATPDKAFELAIVDPPYGIDAGNKLTFRESRAYQDVITKYKKGDWDKSIPTKEYFVQLFRVSVNQIIWGANHFVEFLPPSRGWCFWDKGYTSSELSFSDAELAFTSFDRTIKACRLKMSDWRNCISNNREKAKNNPNIKIHPTQKPVALYRWLVENYAKKGDKILDSHMGSGSIAIACHYAGYHLTATELDSDYFGQSVERIKRETAQTSFLKDLS
jgi:site-specific DNA-methyltransferase (adenine-specific)